MFQQQHQPPLPSPWAAPHRQLFAGRQRTRGEHRGTGLGADRPQLDAAVGFTRVVQVAQNATTPAGVKVLAPAQAHDVEVTPTLRVVFKAAVFLVLVYNVTKILPYEGARGHDNFCSNSKPLFASVENVEGGPHLSTLQALVRTARRAKANKALRRSASVFTFIAIADRLLSAAVGAGPGAAATLCHIVDLEEPRPTLSEIVFANELEV